MDARSLTMLGAAAAVLLLWRSSAYASIDDSTGLVEIPQGDVPVPNIANDWPNPDPLFDPSLMIDYLGGSMTPEQATKALLYTIRACEHAAADVAQDLDYMTFYGGTRFYDLSDHPVITGELRGVPLDNLGPRYAGKVSTAAGAFQITRPTWADVRQAGAWGEYLSDFSPESQDEAARRLLIRAGVIPLLNVGNIQGAIRKASAVWASLPYSTAGQGGRSMEFALARFNEALASA